MERTLVIEALEKIGEKVLLQGWVDTKRDHGKITFVDLRDKSGVVQCIGVGIMGEITPESVLEISGTVKKRPDDMINEDLETGAIEVKVEEYKILNDCKELPIPLDTDGLEINEKSRLKYRYLDLRRKRMREIVRLRSDYASALRKSLSKYDFVEVETPMLTKATKEGARDFIVPSRHYPGKFYALPQSPQQYKQLLMTSGVERYFQFARCIRDEDLRADRGYEHTQIDLELSFVTREQVMQIVEDVVRESMLSVGGKLRDGPFQVIDYKDAIEKYGDDKFDLRTEKEKKDNVLALAWVINFPFFKKVDKEDAVEVADGKSGWTFTHNPFSQPLPEHLDTHLNKESIEKILTSQYDLVCNGYEIGGGSIRAHNPAVLRTTFEIMGYEEEEIKQGIGHMLEAFELGTPPHGGIGMGLDRQVMILAGESSLKEVIAFPMTSSGRTAVMDAPNDIDENLLEELHLQIKD